MSVLLSSYNKFMQKKPIVGNMLTAGVCYATGDYIAQKIDIHTGKRTEIDKMRLAIMTSFGVACAGPIYWLWFSKIERMPQILDSVVRWNTSNHQARQFKSQFGNFIKEHGWGKVNEFQFVSKVVIDEPVFRSKTILCAKVLADQWIFSSLYPLFFMVTTGTALEMSKKESKFDIKTFSGAVAKSFANAKEKWPKIFFTDCAVWPQIQMINFAFVPPHLHGVFVSIVNIGWNAFLCYSSQDGGH